MSAFVASAVLMFGAPLRAQGDEDPRERARALLDQGNKLLQAGDADGAIEKFQQALRAYRSPKIHVNLAEAHRAAKHPAQAMRHYEIFMARGTSKPSVLRKIEKRARGLEESIARLELNGALEGATVTVDSWRAPWREGWRIPIDPGRHLIVVSKEDLRDFETRIDVRAGELKQLTVELETREPEPPPPPVDLAARPPPAKPAIVATTNPDDDKPLTKQWWFWAGVGGAVVAVVAIGVVAGTTGGDDRLPMGDLTSNTSDWGRL